MSAIFIFHPAARACTTEIGKLASPALYRGEWTLVAMAWNIKRMAVLAG
jgi:hypothetical protein